MPRYMVYQSVYGHYLIKDSTTGFFVYGLSFIDRHWAELECQKLNSPNVVFSN